MLKVNPNKIRKINKKLKSHFNPENSVFTIKKNEIKKNNQRFEITPSLREEKDKMASA